MVSEHCRAVQLRPATSPMGHLLPILRACPPLRTMAAYPLRPADRNDLSDVRPCVGWAILFSCVSSPPVSSRCLSPGPIVPRVAASRFAARWVPATNVGMTVFSVAGGAVELNHPGVLAVSTSACPASTWPSKRGVTTVEVPASMMITGPANVMPGASVPRSMTGTVIQARVVAS